MDWNLEKAGLVRRGSVNASETFNKGKTLVIRTCLNCGKQLLSSHSTAKYCDNICQAEYEHKEVERRRYSSKSITPRWLVRIQLSPHILI